MSALQRLHPSEDHVIWRQNESIIRQLYQEDKKTLKEVKAIMENDKGFPVTPLSIWEIKLRALGMRKKLKQRDWYVVYQHIRPRLQYEGGKTLRKPTAIMINGTKKPWGACWKEFRRNQVLDQGPHQGPLPPLPSGILIRTPSPELLESTLRSQQSSSFHKILLRLFHTTIIGFQPLLPVNSHSETEPNDALRYPDFVYRLCLEGIPFTKLLAKISDTTHGKLSSLLVENLGEIQDEIHLDCGPSNNHAAVGNVISWERQLTGMIQSSTPTCQELSLDFDSHHHLFVVIYLLSNSHIRLRVIYEVCLERIVENLFIFVSRRVLLTLFQSRLPSIKAAWEKLLIGATYCKNKEAFRVLITAGMENDWLEETVRGHQHLHNALKSNCADLVSTLLARGCRADSACAPNYVHSIVQRQPAIMEALENDNLDCAKLLIQNCDVNREFNFPALGNITPTNFVMFIAKFDGDKLCHHHCLDYFLEQGADVDYELTLRRSNVLVCFPTDTSWFLKNTEGLIRGWPFSILDYFYYFHRPVFPKLAAFSKSSTLFTRSKALSCLEQGVHVLREYLQEDLIFARPWEKFARDSGNSDDVPVRKNECLEALLAEQFILGMYRPDRNICYETVQALLEVGVDLKTLSTRTGLPPIAPNILYATACFIVSEEGAGKERGLHLLQMLLDHGFQVQADALSAALDDDAFRECYWENDLSIALEDRCFEIQHDDFSSAANAHGVAILDLLAGYCTDLKRYGANALGRAVSRGNFEATQLLLDKGVDPNSTLDDLELSSWNGDTIFAIAALKSSLAMMKYLVQRGTSPRIWKHEESPFELLVNYLEDTSTNHELFVKVQYIVEDYVTITDPACPSARLLELCALHHRAGKEDRRSTFKYLLNKGAKLRPGSPLAEWIASDGGHQLVREMLDAGADPDAFSFETPSCFEKSVPVSERGRTPLQAAAGIGDYTLVCMLLERGADVNRPALGKYNHTALQAICIWDPLLPEERTRKAKIIQLLLAKGADVNASDYFHKTALIYAAELGDLSTAFILLKHGAKLDAGARDHRNYFGNRNTALDAAAENGRLDMVALLLNANGLSGSAYSDGKDYDGAIQQARAKGHFVIAETIREHSRNRKRWDESHGQVVETRISPGQPPAHSLALRTHSGAFPWPRIEARLTPCENIQGVPVLDKANGLCSALDGFMADSSTSASKPKGKEAIDLSETRVIEEIEDGSPLADTELEEPSGERHGRTGDLALDTGRASPGPEEWLRQRREQNWVENEQQNIDPVVSSSLVTDVFMGFSEFSSP